MTLIRLIILACHNIIVIGSSVSYKAYYLASSLAIMKSSSLLQNLDTHTIVAIIVDYNIIIAVVATGNNSPIGIHSPFSCSFLLLTDYKTSFDCFHTSDFDFILPLAPCFDHTSAILINLASIADSIIVADSCLAAT